MFRRGREKERERRERWGERKRSGGEIYGKRGVRTTERGGGIKKEVREGGKGGRERVKGRDFFD